MQQIGIVDLGSNTARMVVYAFEPGRWFRLADQIREPIRLGEGIGRDGRLTEGAMQRARAALTLCADYARSTGLPKLEILGTSALRDAPNRDRFLSLIRPLGLDIRVLSGTEEAELGVLAVGNGFELEEAWIVDLGGGSAQVSRMQNRTWAEGGAHPLGAVRLTERHLAGDPPRRREVRQLEAELEEILGPVAEAMRRRPLPLIALGGTIRNLARVIQREGDYPLDRLHDYFVTRADLEQLTERLLGLKAGKRARISGIKPDRADIIVAGALVFRWLLRATGLDGLRISGHGVREGVLFRHFLPRPHLIPDLRPFSVQNVLGRYAQSKEHIARARALAGRLFELLEPLHGLGPRDADLLDAAAQLQDIGLAVNYYRHDLHGAYLVSSAPLNGFSHREQALLALLVRYHLKGTPGLGRFRDICEAGDKQRLTALVACLRIADHLDRSRAGRVTDIEVEIGANRVRLAVRAAEDATIELWKLEQHGPLFQRAFGRRLRVRPRRPRPAHEPSRAFGLGLLARPTGAVRGASAPGPRARRARGGTPPGSAARRLRKPPDRRSASGAARSPRARPSGRPRRRRRRR